jgi:hypothetical protein
MAKVELTPLSATIMLLLLAIAVGTMIMSWGGFEVEEHNGEAEVSGESFCDPANALKIKYINKEITLEEYEMMKSVIGEE